MLCICFLIAAFTVSAGRLFVIEAGILSEEDDASSFWEDPMIRSLVELFFGDVSSGQGSVLLDADENGIPQVPYIHQGFGVYDFTANSYTHTEILSHSFPDGCTFSAGACGYCCSAMAVSYIAGHLVLPTDFEEGGSWMGTWLGAATHDVGKKAAARYGIETRQTQSIDDAYQELKNGNLVMVIEQGGGVPGVPSFQGVPDGGWTADGHFILMIGVLPDGSIAVNDSASTQRTYWFNGKKGWTKEQISLRASGSPTYTIFVCPDGMKKSEGQDAKAKAIVQACKTVPSPGEGLCAAWVTKVYMTAGAGNPTGDARDMYAALPELSEKDVRERKGLSPGMIVALQTCNGGSDAKTYGHVGIYIGGGQIMDNVGYIETQSIDLWLSKYCPAGMLPRWGYL